MAYTRPDVYIEEILTPEIAPQGVSTSIASFVGATLRGPANKAIFIDSFDSFKRVFGDTAVTGESMFYSVRSFFENGGSACYVVRAISSAQLATSILPANDTLLNDASVSLLKFSAGYRGEDSFGSEGKKLGVSVSEIGASAIRTANMVNGERSVVVDSINGFNVGDIVLVAGTLSDNNAASDHLKIESIESGINQAGTATEHTLNFTTGITLAGTLTASSGSIKVLAYNVDVKLDGSSVETFNRVSLDPSSDNYIETIINDEQIGSRFIKVEDLLPSGDVLSNAKEINSGELSLDHGLLSNGETELTAFSISTDLDLALKALDSKDAVNLLCVPPSILSSGLFPSASLHLAQVLMLNYVSGRMDMFAILDAPAGKTAAASGSGSIGEYRTNTLGVDSYWGAMYFPHLKVQKTLGKNELITIPPSGAIAGLYSRVDAIGAPQGGVASAPAGYGDFGQILGISGLEVLASGSQHGDLNEVGVNCIRVIDRGVANGGVSANVLGARTLSSTLDFRYINVRRMMNFIEKRVKGIGEAKLFRNNGPQLWAELTSEIEAFLGARFDSGELAGNSKAEAFFVKIDSNTNTAENIKRGILVGEIGVALLRPAEFIVFKFSQVQAN